MARVPMSLFGGPGDGAEVHVSGTPPPEFVTWSQVDPSHSPDVAQFAFRPPTQDCALYRLDRIRLRYCFEAPRKA